MDCFSGWRAGRKRACRVSNCCRHETVQRQHGHSIQIALDDGLSKRGGWGVDSPKISADSLVVKIDNEPVSFTLDLQNNRLRVPLPPKLKTRKLRLFVDFENVFGQHVLHPRINVKVGAG